MQFIDISNFISENITHRRESLFKHDLEANKQTLVSEIGGKKILVIGGAGTIGSSFIKASLSYFPESLYVIDTSENGLTELTRDLRSNADLRVPKEYKTYPINFSDKEFTRILKEQGPFDIVANFAAHKHVRSEKDHYSISALLRNNVIHAHHLLQDLLDCPPSHFFCVSTDKAANPVNIMGASKKMMENMILAFSNHFPITTARFANVAFSNGSLLAGFNERIAKKQPLSAPNDVRRYFVSPAESGEICLLACILGETGEIFFPKLREEQMMTFSDIADVYLKSMGYNSLKCKSEEEAKELMKSWHVDKNDYPVYYFESDTSGEKGYEEFFTTKENVDTVSYKSLGVVMDTPKKTIKKIEEELLGLSELLNMEELSKEKLVRKVVELVPDFRHVETGKNLDQKM